MESKRQAIKAGTPGFSIYKGRGGDRLTFMAYLFVMNIVHRFKVKVRDNEKNTLMKT